MSDDTERNKPANHAEPRRFKLRRNVKPPAIETREEQAMRELKQEEADSTLRGSPETDRELGRGCTGCLKVTGLLFLIMFASIITTWCINKR